MELKPIDKHIQQIQNKRAELFIHSLRFIDGYYNNCRNYYLTMLLISLVIFLSDLSLFFSFESEVFIKISLLFATFSFLFALINYLNSLEKNSEKMGKIFGKYDFRNKQEIEILKNFNAGKIDEKQIRNFYLNQEVGVDEKYFVNQYEIVLRWINFISLSLAIILILFNFF